MKLLLTLFSTLLASSWALADTTLIPGNIAVHIAQVHYEHPVRILHPYLDVWHMKGPLAQKAATSTLNKYFSNAQWCDKAHDASVVLLLEPHMFYNPQMQVFHGEIIAKVFTQTGGIGNIEPAIVRIKKQAEQNGSLTVKPDFYMEKAYVKAMEKVIAELKKNQLFINALNVKMAKNVETICPALDELPISKLYY
ncbi:hypothetical protein Meth11DRAFT_0762 [Methylophilaceae bacterium 11]|jgi:hypothetical protein|uniref:hypothetical protein n=1 Tax=unclassified Methylotenera TaxID=2643294 RepID=UPI00037DD638|nr:MULTISPECIES: hypothetical protein [unclassified Methylotenera]EUJ09958.1 hypothetical protein Meth11DRAFT_0762 [Methylophilaceae bacterium 11]